MNIKCKVKDNTVIIPKYQTSGAAGMDLCAHSYASCDNPYFEETFETTRYNRLLLLPGERILIKTGLFLEIPEGYEAQIRPRSGLALKYGISIVNPPGTIDSDYRGEIGVILINHGSESFEIHKGDRIAQMVFNKVEQCPLVLVEDLSETERGEGGFNSTGIK